MKVYDAQSLRNVALVGHSGAGKTQLLSALLFDAGAVNRLGRVDEGTTVTDYDEEEISRKHTLSASLAYVEWNRTKINFIDTPGMANFLSDARAALRVSDAALVVVDAVSGVQVSTEKVWGFAAEMETPRLVVLNRLDRERASLTRALESLRGVFGRTVIPIQIPIGEEKDFRGVVDLVAMKSWTFAADGSGTASEAPIPADLQSTAQGARDALIEMVAEADDALMEKFFESGTLDAGRARRGPQARRVCGPHRPPALHVGHREHRDAAAPRRDAELRAVAGRAALHGHGQRIGGQRRGEGLGQLAGRHLRLEDRRRPLCRTHHDVPGHLRLGEGGLDGAEHLERDARAVRPPDAAAGKDARPTFRKFAPAILEPWPS